MKRTQRHLPVWPPAWRLDLHFRERLARGGSPLPVRPRLRRSRRRRPVPLWRVAELTRRIFAELALGTALGLASVVALGPVAYEMGWI